MATPSQITTGELPMLASTEIISTLRAEAYRLVAARYGGRIVMTELAGPGDTVVLDSQPITGTDRSSNRRDRGDLVAVNPAEIAEPSNPYYRTYTLDERHRAIRLENPATFRTGRMAVFYERTNFVHDAMLHHAASVMDHF